MRRRKAEIRKIADFLAQRQEIERAAAVDAVKGKWDKPAEAGWDWNYILLGDFNIISPEHGTMAALEDAGFTVATKPHRTNLGSNMHYDQIAYRAAHPGFEVRKSGVFSMLDHVYRDVDASHYVEVAKIAKLTENGRTGTRAKAYFKQYYRRQQLSDHKLLWAEIYIDYSHEYLQAVIDET